MLLMTILVFLIILTHITSVVTQIVKGEVRGIGGGGRGDLPPECAAEFWCKL